MYKEKYIIFNFRKKEVPKSTSGSLTIKIFKEFLRIGTGRNRKDYLSNHHTDLITPLITSPILESFQNQGLTISQGIIFYFQTILIILNLYSLLNFIELLKFI